MKTALIVSIAAMILAAMLVPAGAHEPDYIDLERWENRKALRSHNCTWYGTDCPRDRRYRRVRQPRPHVHTAVPAPGAQRCLPNAVHVVSTEHQTEEKAKGQAQLQWMGHVSALNGFIYAHFPFARGVRWRCFPAQTHDTWTGAFSKGVNKFVGGTGQNMRCELWASPCSAPVERADDEED